MSASFEFYFDFGSPSAFVAHCRIPAILARTGANVSYKPMLLGGVFKATGNSSPVNVAAKSKWLGPDLQRYLAREDLPAYTMNSHFPVNTLYLMRGAIAAQRMGCFDAYCQAVFNAMWRDDVNMADPAQIARVLSEANLDANAIIAATQDPEIKAALIAATEEAVSRGVFGAPTFFVAGQMHFGQDRLGWVEAALIGGANSTPA